MALEKKYLDSVGLATLVGKIKVGIAAAIENIPKATTGVYGLTKLSSATSSNAEDLAATPKAVKVAYDLAASKASTSTATTTADGLMSKEDKTKLNGIETGAQVNTVISVASKTGEVILSKSDVGLDKVDNTSDKDKPISNATKNALDTLSNKVDTKASQADLNTANGKIKTNADNITALQTAVDALSSATDFIGVTTTEISDGSKINQIVLKNGKNYDAVKGDIVIGDGTNKEFIYDGAQWLELGDTTGLAQKVTALEEAVVTPLEETEVGDIFDNAWK